MDGEQQKHAQGLVSQIFKIDSKENFNKLALEVYRYQYNYNPVYRKFVELSREKLYVPQTINDIPFLPIELFKSHKIICNNTKTQTVFESSGTTGINTSKHYISDIQLYKHSFTKTFNFFFGDNTHYCVLALLPGYLERKNSSLIFMVKHLIDESQCTDSGFYLNEYEQLVSKIKQLQQSGKKILLIGVSYALLDIAEQYNLSLSNVIVMETGGMKGKRKELTKEELHNKLKKGFGVKTIHSEYGMTELLSQAYSKGSGLFETPYWMQIRIRDIYDPFCMIKAGKSGGINVIDLANIHSCSFIETNDIGKLHKKGKFEVMGRFDNSDIRGCNLMVQ